MVIRQVLSQLTKAALIQSRPGAGGGIVLSKRPEDITLRGIYAAISDSAGLVLGLHPGECNDGVSIMPIVADYLNELFSDAEQAFLAKLETVSIQDLTQEIVNRLKQ